MSTPDIPFESPPTEIIPYSKSKKGKGSKVIDEFPPLYSQIFQAKYGFANADNFPIYGPNDFGKGGTPNYYYLSEPDQNALANTARYTPLGYRGTYGFAYDITSNNFMLEFPGSELDPLTIKQINQDIYTHNCEIGFYDEFRKALGYNYEQGEALLNIFRQGDGDLRMYEELISKDPNYGNFNTKPDPEKDILRVEAVNKMDYMIPMIAAFGLPMYYNINFYSDYNTFKGYNIHPQRCIRIRTDNLDYDQYKGQSKLKACFAQLTIIMNVCRAAGVACHRFGYGQPWIRFKNVRNKNQFAYVKDMVGNPTNEDYFMTPDENISDIKMLGVSQSQMDMAGVIQIMIDQISACWKIPETVLLGKEAGVSGSEVYERNYFSTLEVEHVVCNKYIRQFIAIDPFYQRIFQKYNIKNYAINWGLKQVMTKEQEADWKMRVYTNITTKMNFATFDECRAEADLPSFTKYFNDPKYPKRKGMCQHLYGVEPEELDAIIPNMGSFRQRALQEILETPPEQEQAKINEELMKGNTPNAIEGKGVKNTPIAETSTSNTANSEFKTAQYLNTQENKAARGSADLSPEQKELAAAKARADMFEGIIRDFKKLSRDELQSKDSLNYMASLWNVNKNEVLQMYDRIQKWTKATEVVKKFKEKEANE